MNITYETDYYAWAIDQAAKLRAGRFAELDIKNLAEEIEDLSKREKRELKNRLIVLLTHLLKWQFQPERRSRSWEVTIRNQRIELDQHLQENPSLAGHVDDVIAQAYRLAIGEAYKQTNLDVRDFPTTCPYTVEQIFADYWPT